MPCWELFEAQDAAYQADVLGEGTVRIGIEAQVRMGWDRYIGRDGVFIGMPGFGESAPYQDLYKHFGITADAVVTAAKARV
jgi:transketolase